MVGILTFGGRRAHHHRQQIGAFAIQPGAATAEIHLQRTVDILLIHPQLAPQGRGILRADRFTTVLPVVAHATDGRIRREDSAYLAGYQP